MLTAFYDEDSSLLQHNAKLAEKTIQNVINSAWTKYDKADENTWPEHVGISLVECAEFANPHIAIFHAGTWKCLDYRNTPLITVTYYTDPQNLKLQHTDVRHEGKE